MTRFIVLDSGPLGLLCHAKPLPIVRACIDWSRRQIEAGALIFIPEIADFEVRRELLRVGNRSSILRFDSLHIAPGFVYLPVTTSAMRLAAEYWATARKRGRPTADPSALDADVILSAQANVLAEDFGEVLVATENVRHIASFVDARRWQDIPVR